MLTFFQEPFSHWCIKARKILDYKNIQYEVKDVGYHDKRELIKTTRQDYVPAIVANGQIITYPDISDYLENLKPDPTIYPDGTKALGKAMENWAHWRLEEVVWRYVVTDFPKTFKDDLERWVFIELQEAKRGSLDLMEVRKPVFRQDMESHLQILDDLLINHRFLLSEKPGLADFAAFGAVFPLHYSGNELPDKFSRLKTWYGAIDRI